jgi:hypothetical protein
MKLFSIALLSPLLAPPFAASAQMQHQNGFAHQDWVVPAGWNVDISQYVNVAVEPPNATFYTLQLGFTPRPNVNDGAYIGLQRIDSGRIVRFSMWNAQNATPGIGATCRPFGGEGVGRTCELPHAFQAGAWYRVRVRLVNANAPGGPLWEGSVIAPNGATQVVGTIQAPPGLGFISFARSFVEYFGLDADGTNACIILPPVSRAVFAAPLLNSGYANYGGTRVGDCSGGRVTPIPGFGTTVVELSAAP